MPYFPLIKAGGGIQCLIDGVAQTEDVSFVSEDGTDTLPYEFEGGGAIVYKNKIHLIGGYNNGNNKHYEWNESSWINSFDISNRSFADIKYTCVTIGDKIYIGKNNKLWEWNGSEWETIYTDSDNYRFSTASFVVYRNELHILGGGNGGSTKHYKWNGSTLVSVSTLPVKATIRPVVVCNDEIHYFGNTSALTHYKWNGISWTQLTQPPYLFSQGSAVSINNVIYVMADSRLYKWTNDTWTNTVLPYSVGYGEGVIVYKNKIHLLGGGSSSTTKKYHYAYIPDSSWSNNVAKIYKLQ